MSFNSWPFAFHQDLSDSISRISRSLSPRRFPDVLYHYTSLKGVLGIAGSRSMRATSVEELQDQSEIRYGVEIVREEVRRQRAVGQFPQQVLNAISDLLISRRAFTFVACLRPTLDNRERDDYCLEFDTLSTSEPRLRPAGLWANVEYRRVIYRPEPQRRAIQQAIAGVVSSLKNASQGDIEGPWGESLMKFHGRVAARSQSLMNLIASFKCCKYRWEDEWRIICSPISSVSLAPDIDDDNFRRLIRGGDKDSKRHIELRMQREDPVLILPFPDSEIPFRRVYYAPGADYQQIRDMLLENGRSDIEVLEHPRVRKRWLVRG